MRAWSTQKSWMSKFPAVCLEGARWLYKNVSYFQVLTFLTFRLMTFPTLILLTFLAYGLLLVTEGNFNENIPVVHKLLNALYMDKFVRRMFALSLRFKCSTNLKWGFPWSMDFHKRCEVIAWTVTSQNLIHSPIRKKSCIISTRRHQEGLPQFVCLFVILSICYQEFVKGFIWIFNWNSWLVISDSCFGKFLIWRYNVTLEWHCTHAEENWSL